MKNLVNEFLDKVEELPKRDNVRSPDDHHHWGMDYPYNKVRRFLMSRVGRDWDSVFSEFVHLDWIPKLYKTREQISHSVLLNTFEKDDEIYFYDNYCLSYNGSEEKIIDYRMGFGDTFYIHPKTRLLCYHKRKIVNNKKLQEKEQKRTVIILGNYHQLLKLDGIWYEVKGEKSKYTIIEVEGLHWEKVRYIPIEKPYKFINGEYYIPYKNAYSYEDIGPKDRLIRDDNESEFYYRWNNKNYSSIKITFCHQINKKMLKKYGIHNDIKINHRCQTCGSTKCIQSHGKRCEVCGVRRCCTNHNHFPKV